MKLSGRATLCRLDLSQPLVNRVEARLQSRGLLLLCAVDPFSESGDLTPKVANLIRQSLILRFCWRQLANEAAQARDARDVAISHKLPHCALSGCDRDTEPLRELAHGLQLLVRLQLARLDLPDELVGDGSVRVPRAG